MDLVVLIDDPGASLEPSHLVHMMGDLLERVRAAYIGHSLMIDGI